MTIAYAVVNKRGKIMAFDRDYELLIYRKIKNAKEVIDKSLGEKIIKVKITYIKTRRQS